jgi:carbonic anhydrase/acetyltransferase-like protein (isoleucine patch superfamily)
LESNINSGDNSIIIGNTFVGKDTILEDNVVIRGDGKEVNIGKNCLLKNRSTVHVASEIQGTEIGDNSLIGEYSIIHACKLGKNIIVGNNSVVMDGSEVGENTIIKNNTLIPPGKKFESFSLIGGSPGKVLKKITEKDYLLYKENICKSNNVLSNNNYNYRSYLEKKIPVTKYTKKNINNTFVAPDAEIYQTIEINEYSSIWFSVYIFSSKNNGKLILGKGSNIQDNCILNTLGQEILIEKRVTIGHNVIILGKSHIKNDAVIGMGSILESNCIIGNNSFVGANSFVKAGTIVPDNTIFAGKPAKFFRKVNEKEKLFFRKGQKIYENLTCNYNNY